MTEKNIQISGNIGNAYFIFKGDSADEVLADVKAVADNYPEFAEAFNVIGQIQAVKDAFAAKAGGFGGGAAKPAAAAPAGPAPAGGGKTFSKPAGNAAQAPDGSYTCSHGAMKLLDYVKKDGGTRVHGWYCQSKDKDYKNKCKPIALEGHGE